MEQEKMMERVKTAKTEEVEDGEKNQPVFGGDSVQLSLDTVQQWWQYQMVDHHRYSPKRDTTSHIMMKISHCGKTYESKNTLRVPHLC